jgi:hypothetical protein
MFVNVRAAELADGQFHSYYSEGGSNVAEQRLIHKLKCIVEVRSELRWKEGATQVYHVTKP